MEGLGGGVWLVRVLVGVVRVTMWDFGGDGRGCLDGRRGCRVRCGGWWGCEVDGLGAGVMRWESCPPGSFGGEGLVALPEGIFILRLGWISN